VEREIPHCTRCPRLAAHLADLRAAHPDWWGRPVPGFGDPGAAILVVGLAPGTRGANRTGVPFRGDAAGEWLYGALAELGLWDGERLRGAYVANAVKCVPPRNRPEVAEVARCLPFLQREIAALPRLRVAVALGRIAHAALLRAFGAESVAAHPFAHGALHRLPGRPPLLASYHPSRQNTHTRRLTHPMWRSVWRRAAKLALGAGPGSVHRGKCGRVGMSEESVRRRVIVRGRVQGVAFRASTVDAARRAGVAGFVRNLADGSVEAVFEGDGRTVAALVEWCRQGPRWADVRELEEHVEHPEGLAGFVVR
jgi:uracil-DNA glycosylase family 4